MRISIVLGAGFGDEGKGRTVAEFVNDSAAPVVVRFNGGHQAGHTVVYRGFRHVFSNFGSGTLQGVPTYWGPQCTVDPVGWLNEGEHLRASGFDPQIQFDLDCPITTPWDKLHQRQNRVNLSHGTCGVGFGTTVAREEKRIRLRIRDLLNPRLFDERLRVLKEYYRDIDIPSELLETFYVAVAVLRNYIPNSRIDFIGKDHIIFEGAQGILLDQDHGFFPNVTRSSCTAKNALELKQKLGWGNLAHSTYYITRCYQTRHGNGWMSNEVPLDLINNQNETNVTNPYQGVFRKGILDLALLRYSLSCDRAINKGPAHVQITCWDHFQPGRIPILVGDKIVNGYASTLLDLIEAWTGLTCTKIFNAGENIL